MWNRETIIEKVKSVADRYGAFNVQQQKQLIIGCEQASDSELFFGLFSFFYDPSLQESKIERQQLAGRLLLEFSPICPLELDGAIYAIPTFWDYSIEEVPWYLCKNFGKLNVVKSLTEVILDLEDGGAVKQNFKTLLFWSKLYKAESS